MWNKGWRQEGDEPDYRFSLANERTFLAWIRTSMALLAGAVLLAQFGLELGSRRAILSISVFIAAWSGVLSAFAYRRWRANEIAIRHGQALPGTFMTPFTAIAAFVVALAILLLLAWH